MKIFILQILVILEHKRNEFLWDMFHCFFEQDYEYLSLHDKYHKYSNKLKVLNEETPEEKQQRLFLLRKMSQEEFDRRPVELKSGEIDAHKFLVLNLDTGDIMERVFYANQTSGNYTQQREFSNNRWLKVKDQCNLALVWKGDNE